MTDFTKSRTGLLNNIMCSICRIVAVDTQAENYYGISVNTGCRTVIVGLIWTKCIQLNRITGTKQEPILQTTRVC